MYYLPLGTTTCRVTALVVTPTAQGLGIGRQLLKRSRAPCPQWRRRAHRSHQRLAIAPRRMRSTAHAGLRLQGQLRAFREATRRLTVQDAAQAPA
jgi:GNAT superfamily N-acetyltransferase